MNVVELNLNSEVNDNTTVDDQVLWKWQEHLGRTVDKDDPIWSKYIQAATAHDDDVVEALSRSMDILLVFSGLFSAVVATFVVQVEQTLDPLETPYIADFNEAKVNKLNATAYDSSRGGLTFKSFKILYIDYPRVTVILWYISFHFALIVAGGAVCVKQWLLEYRRSNSIHRVPYNRAIHHQERYASLKRWFVPEFADLLGCILLLDLIPFLVGCMFHLRRWKTGDEIFFDFSSGILAIYAAFLVFTIIVGIFVPSSPYSTPISNLVKRTSRIVFRKLVDNFRYKAVILILLLVALIAVLAVWKNTKNLDLWLILLWVAPTVLIAGFGLRNGLKTGRISHFAPVMTLAIGIITPLILLFILIQTYNQNKINIVVLPFTFLPAFTLVVMALSHRFSTVNSQSQFPVVALLLSSIGLVSASFLAWNFTFYHDTYLKWIPPISVTIVWASMMNLSMVSVMREGMIEEDTRAVEALGWLIAQTGDIETLHDALTCIPSIANTPYRRQLLLSRTLQTFTLRINSLIDAPDQRFPLMAANGGSRKPDLVRSCGMDQESRLTFYITCLAEMARVTVPLEYRPSFFQMVWNRWVSRLIRSWFFNNWYRFLTIPPSNQTFSRELRSYSHWYPWLRSSPPDMLRSDLETLSKHRNTYLSWISRAVLSQLYPSESSADDILSWQALRDTRCEVKNLSSHGTLIELRMVTIRAINVLQHSQSFDSSVRRYLQRYCDSTLKLWTSENLLQDEKVFGEAMILGYIVTENHSEVLRVTGSGDPIPMKAAQCMMALKWWYDRRGEGKEITSVMDEHVQTSFACSLVSATAKYLQLIARSIEKNDRLGELYNEGRGDEDSVGTAMKYLENILLQLVVQDWPISFLGHVVTALENFYFINDHAKIELLPLNIHYDLRPLMTRLKSRASSSIIDDDRISAVRAISRILNRVPNPSNAWSNAVDESGSLIEIISSMAQDESPKCRISALSTLIDTPILHPATLGTSDCLASSPNNQDHLSSAPREIRLDFLPNHHPVLAGLYKDVFRDPSALFQAILVPGEAFNKEFISTSVSILSLMAHSLGHDNLPPALWERDKYPKTLVLIASHNDTELVSISTRKSAIHLFIKLWAYSDERDAKNSEVQGIQNENSFGGETYLGEMTNAIDLLTNRQASIELDCISLWTDRVEAICQDIQGAEVLSRSGLVEVLRDAVAWTDFGRPSERDREDVFARLTIVQGRVTGLTSEPDS